ncbi:helix-turn-helix domain-containing protein [Streptomyces sp. NPDC088337]|uniref:helix-turn-helix domain-containing protein n=1 Tax=unclassified Streptomyces TaxID=2593676 RepID=UPI0037F3432B
MPAPLTIAARRAMVEELRRQEPTISARKIAARLGVGKDAIRRDLDAIETEQRQQATIAATAAPVSTPPAPAPAPPNAPNPAPPVPDPAPPAPAPVAPTAPPTPVPAPTEPQPAPHDTPPDRLVLVLDEPLRQSLAVLRAACGGADTPKQNGAAARAAIHAVADTMREAQQRNQEGPTP